MATPRKSFTTPKGSELPLLNLKGKEYLQVAHRLVWFRETYPDGVLKTQMIALSGEGQAEYAVFKTEVYIPAGHGSQMIASAHKKETRGGFDDFIEKAETGSIGRALALAGFGTQFTADELNEGDRLADAPVDVIAKSTPAIVPASINNAAPTGTLQTSGVATISGRSSFRKNVTPVSAGSSDDGI